jgi:hypothetical protein
MYPFDEDPHWIASRRPVGQASGLILRIGTGRDIGRPTHFSAALLARTGGHQEFAQRATTPSTTSWAMAQRVAAARLETPIFV